MLKQGLDYAIRPMAERDIPQVIEIDREAFPTQWPHPTYSSFKQELTNHMAHHIVAYKRGEFISRPVAEKDDHKTVWGRFRELFNHENSSNKVTPESLAEYIIGMAGFWVMVGEAHITTIAVRNTYRGQRVGERLLIELIDVAIQFKANLVTLEVRVSNEMAQRLYDKYGFSKAGVRRRYYTDNSEDAFIMTTDNITEQSFQDKFGELKRAYEQKNGMLNEY
jgi:ribosomal-protein-alanine N-acetyltransferase